MNEFDEIFLDALDVLRVGHGGTLTFLDDEGDPVEFLAVGITPEALEEVEDGEGGKTRRHVRDVEVLKTDYVAVLDDELTFGGVGYVVERIASDDGVTQLFRMVRLVSSQVARKGYRK